MLNLAERQAMNAVVEQEDAWMSERGISWSANTDFSEWPAFAAQINGFLNTTHDPNVRPPGPDDMWFGFTDSCGKPVGAMAVALFPNSKLAELIRTGRLWYDTPPNDWPGNLLFETDGIVAEGDIVQGGAIMVHRNWRTSKTGQPEERLSHHLVRLARAKWLSLHDADWWTGTIRSAIVENRTTMHVHGLKTEDCIPIMSGHLPVMNISDRFYTMQVTVEELINSVKSQTALEPAERFEA